MLMVGALCRRTRHPQPVPCIDQQARPAAIDRCTVRAGCECLLAPSLGFVSVAWSALADADGAV